MNIIQIGENSYCRDVVINLDKECKFNPSCLLVARISCDKNGNPTLQKYQDGYNFIMSFPALFEVEPYINDICTFNMFDEDVIQTDKTTNINGQDLKVVKPNQTSEMFSLLNRKYIISDFYNYINISETGYCLKIKSAKKLCLLDKCKRLLKIKFAPNDSTVISNLNIDETMMEVPSENIIMEYKLFLDYKIFSLNKKMKDKIDTVFWVSTPKK